MHHALRTVLVVAAVLVVGVAHGGATADRSFIESVQVVDPVDDDGDGYVSDFSLRIAADTDCLGCNDESEDDPNVDPYLTFEVDRGSGFEEVGRTDVLRNDPDFEATYQYSHFPEAAIDTAQPQRITIRIELRDRDPLFGEKLDQATVSVRIESPAEDENAPPSARFSVDSRIGQVGPAVVFDASGSSDPDAPLQAYRWDFDGDGSVDATGETVHYTFERSGPRQVRLKVVDAAGATDVAERSVPIRYDTDGDYLADSIDPFPTSRLLPILPLAITLVVVLWSQSDRIATAIERCAATLERFTGGRDGPR